VYAQQQLWCGRWTQLITACWRALSRLVLQAASYWCWVRSTGACASAGVCHVTTTSAAALTSSPRWTAAARASPDVGWRSPSRHCSKQHLVPRTSSLTWRQTTPVSKVAYADYHSSMTMNFEHELTVIRSYVHNSIKYLLVCNQNSSTNLNLNLKYSSRHILNCSFERIIIKWA